MPLKRPLVKAVQVGRILYNDGLILQKNTASNIKESGTDGVLLLLEHQPVYTVGIRSKEYDKDFEEKLLKTGAEFFRTNRGGLITFHGPGQSPHTGVWIKDNKVCAIGVHGSRYITSHGLAINCNVDLNWFSHIIPCGILDKGVTSLTKELLSDITVEDIVPNFISSFKTVMKCDCVFT
ncbi:lipoyl(octanoyl) transferase 2 [Lycorma delicatula]|uniref:lipoyl(octanoyl) transferase 2 n=1 Tax=Lycorma delicatula TaxID=130591 RepID=UPI003F517422